MTITATVIAHSISEQDIAIASVECVYQAFFHQDLMTHRAFSRNASSTRAIPMKEMIRRVRENPAMPIHWGKNQPGMQAREEVDETTKALARQTWLNAAEDAMFHAEHLARLGVHKQVGNMLLWPFMHFKTLITATDWNNFFALRDHEAARPEIQKLARQIKAAIGASTPKLLKPGEWHLPYVTDEERCAARVSAHGLHAMITLSVARCASVSYDTVDGKRMTLERATALYAKLLSEQPIHASPAEHVAYPDNRTGGQWHQPQFHGNFRGWIQYRKTLPNEYVPG